MSGEPQGDRAEYEYYGLLATTWDLFRGDTSNWPDKSFYLDLIHRFGQPVLDVGCGTGRLLLDYLQQGIDVDGVDNSPEMLEICRAKAAPLGLKPNLYEQRMESLDLPRRYQTILVPSSSFQLITDPELAVQSLHNFYRSLNPGGALAMPFMLFWQAGEPAHSEWTLTGEATNPEDGSLYRRWSREKFDLENQLVELVEERYEVLRDGEMIATEYHQTSPSGRWYTQSQAKALYREAGFIDIQLFHEFTHEPAAGTDALFTVLGVRPM